MNPDFNRPWLFVILGTPDSGRRAGLLDLIENDPTDVGSNVVLMSRADGVTEAARSLDASHAGQLVPWSWDDGVIQCNALSAGAGSARDRIFLITEPLRNPVDQLEAIVGFAERMQFRIGRIFTWIDCRRAVAHTKELEKWLDACVHFSDCVMLSRRDGIPGKQIQEIEDRYKKQHLPCLFFPVKKKGFDNPALILEPVARRASLAFDMADPMFEDDPDIEEEPDLVGEVDPYFARMVSGRREKVVPEIADLF